MDENNNEYMEHKEQNNYYAHHHEHCFLCKHPFLKTLLTALLTLFGAYLAFYVVTDWHYKRMLDPAVQIRKMDRMIQKEEHQMHKMFDKEIRKEKKLERKASDLIQVEKTDDAYKIIVDLKPFNNSPTICSPSQELPPFPQTKKVLLLKNAFCRVQYIVQRFSDMHSNSGNL